MRNEMIGFLNRYTSYSFDVLETFSDDVLVSLCKMYAKTLDSEDAYFANPYGYEALYEEEVR